MNKNWIIFGLSNSKKYASEISSALGIKCGEMITSRFADGEILVKSKELVRGKEVILVQSTSRPVNDNLMELLIAIDALKRASSNSITVLIPYFGYARQDRKTQGREPITCKLVADFIVQAGANKVILIDIHSKQTQGFFNVPVDVLTASPILINEYYKKNNYKPFCVVAPDYGAVKKVRDIADNLFIEFAIVDKRRPKPNEVEVSNILGDVENKDCVIIDDMIDTGGTVLATAKLLREKKAKKITVIATHGLFSNNSIEKFIDEINKSNIDELITSNTIIENEKINHPKIHVVNLSSLLSEVLKAHIEHKSVSDIYKKYWEKTKNHA